MAWTVYGNVISTADNTGAVVGQPIKFNKNIVLRAVRCWFINFNDAAFTSIKMRIYSSNPDGSARSQLFESTTELNKADFFTDNYGVRESYWEFNDVALDANYTYVFVPFISGYTGDDTSHLAWRSSYPDPVYRTGFTLLTTQVLKHPLTLTPISADL